MEEWLERQRKRGRNFEVDTSEPLQNEHQGQWAAKALEEFQKRRQSERENQKLKEIGMNQIKLAKALQQVLEQDFEVEGETLQDVMEMGMTYAADADTQPGLIQVQGP
ncbi:uncharacterized protein KRP23_12140 [Phytophthora ramorum]|uniref:uncharacterized protein n=1 Tax=Phytophthora ramorum TaxID=164328 RepID=UPI0030B4E895|nr:hypothetical protein KRP23_12140 [Phytophthora ramorum]